MSEVERDEISRRAKALLFKAGRAHYGPDDHFSSFVRIGNYALYWSDGQGLTVNDHGYYHGTIFRVGPGGSFEQARPEHLPALLETLRGSMILDDLADV
jgi:hypothetical protein